MIAAISTEGFKRLYEAMDIAIAAHRDRALEQLVAGAWAYIQFGLNDPDHFKVTFSGILEKEKDYPAFVEVSQQTFRRVVSIVEACQREKALRTNQPEVFAVSIWVLLHRLVSLFIEGQISHSVLDHHSIEEIFVTALSPFLLVPIPTEILSE